MPTAPKKTVTKIAAQVAVKPKSRYARIRDEARANHKPVAPYEFDGTEPPTLITAPDTVERVTAVAELIDRNGDFDFSNLRRLFSAFCGSAFPAVWSVIKDEPIEVLMPLIEDINGHFGAVPAEEGEDLPGGD